MKNFKQLLVLFLLLISIKGFSLKTDLKFDYSFGKGNNPDTMIKSKSYDVSIHIRNLGTVAYSGNITFNVFVGKGGEKFSTDSPQTTFEIDNGSDYYSIAPGKEVDVLLKITIKEPDFRADSTNIVIIWPSDGGVKDGKKKILADNNLSNNCSQQIPIWVKTSNGNWTAIQSIQNNKFSFYPNPASEKIYICLNQNEKGKLRITDINGKTILSKELSGMENSFDLPLGSNSDFVSGIYFINLITNKETTTQKFIIAR
ncbi:MAG: T9SS type A sorting domain-containing protein [Bacteroidetes bacterium]|nr:T9SS type A sorting domain-containing protein [Bacteroidota bacterium]